MYSWDVCRPLMESPHTLIAGTTGSGKSVLLNSCLYSVIGTGAGFVFIDLKRVELAQYKNIKECLMYITEPSKVSKALDDVIYTMENRYSRMSGRSSSEPPIYVVIDELADLVETKGILDQLVKIGRLGRAANIHLLCATQDPSRRTLKAQLMQNFTCTVALRCRSAIESRQIIGVAGAEKLPLYGKGLRWDATGIHEFDVPMTPDEEINALPKVQTKREFVPETSDTNYVAVAVACIIIAILIGCIL